MHAHMKPAGPPCSSGPVCVLQPFLHPCPAQRPGICRAVTVQHTRAKAHTRHARVAHAQPTTQAQPRSAPASLVPSPPPKTHTLQAIIPAPPEPSLTMSRLPPGRPAAGPAPPRRRLRPQRQPWRGRQRRLGRPWQRPPRPGAAARGPGPPAQKKPITIRSTCMSKGIVDTWVWRAVPSRFECGCREGRPSAVLLHQETNKVAASGSGR